MTRTEKLQWLLDDLKLEWDDDTVEMLLADPPRYIEIGKDGDLGAVYGHNTLAEVATSITMGVCEPWSFAGFYDLDEEHPQAKGAMFEVTLNSGESDSTHIVFPPDIDWPEVHR